MSILIINTISQADERAQAAIRELTSAAGESRVIQAAEMKIHSCIGCNDCWLKTPGVCAIKDDYEQILHAYLQYDATFFIADTALGFIDYRAKNVIDRVLPLVTMYTCIVDGQMRHVLRYDKKFRFGLLYAGAGDDEYLKEWLKRFCINFGGDDLGVFSIDRAKEAAVCI